MICLISKSMFHNGASNAAKRKKVFDKIKSSPSYISASYSSFGYDYFDSNHTSRGYMGYKYDGRFAEESALAIENYQVSNVLEIGCAKGFLLYEFFKLGCSVIGVDISDYARQHAPCEIKDHIYEDIDQVPVEIRPSIDFVILKDVLPHLTLHQVNFLLNFLQTNFSAIRYVYIELFSAENSVEADSLMTWDPTNQICKPVEGWIEILSQFNFRYFCNFKSII